MNHYHKNLVKKILKERGSIDEIEEVSFTPKTNAIRYNINGEEKRISIKSNLDYICLWEWFCPKGK
jgi:hypothetical protein